MRTPWRQGQRAAPDYERADDRTLMAAALDDPQAFAALYDRHAAMVLGYFARRTADAETAADLTAETFTAALSGLSRYDPDRGVPAAWLFGIAHNLLSKWARLQAVDQRARPRLALDPIALDEYSAGRIAAMVDAERARVWLAPALERLSPVLRQAVELRILGDLPYDEVARVAGCSVGVARVRVCRALAQLSSSAAEAEPGAVALAERSAS
jgi:RNA polymerase sigma-70 factor (ECF subfamily)